MRSSPLVAGTFQQAGITLWKGWVYGMSERLLVSIVAWGLTIAGGIVGAILAYRLAEALILHL